MLTYILAYLGVLFISGISHNLFMKTPYYSLATRLKFEFLSKLLTCSFCWGTWVCFIIFTIMYYSSVGELWHWPSKLVRAAIELPMLMVLSMVSSWISVLIFERINVIIISDDCQ